MTKYLLDTNIVIFLFKSKYNIYEKMAFVGLENCFISEITLAELKYGAEKSSDPIKSHQIVEFFSESVSVIPISKALNIFATEKIRLEKAGTPMHDNFDVLIAATAIYHNLVVVTNNVKHFKNFTNIAIEDWTLPHFPNNYK